MFRHLAHVLRVLRLIALALLGALVGSVIMPGMSHSMTEAAERELTGVYLGALAGIASELFIRALGDGPNPPPYKLTPRAWLIVITYAAFWVVVAVYQLR